MPARMHDDELVIEPRTVRALLRDQAPELADLPVRPLPSTGSTNALFRLGDDLVVRLPRQPGGSGAIRKEARWGRWLGERLPVAVPDVVLLGEPGHGYPERWTLTRWCPGETPATPDRRPDLADDLAAVVTAMRAVEVPAEALADPALRSYRAEPLGHIADAIRRAIEDCRALSGLELDLDAAAALWEDAVRLPQRTGGPCWVHGDLLAENLLVDGDGLAAVLDLGGLCVGDPAVDLVVCWEVLDGTDRSWFRAAVGVDDATWGRGRAWALAIALMTFPYYWHTMPQRCASRLVMARAVLDSAAGRNPAASGEPGSLR